LRSWFFSFLLSVVYSCADLGRIGGIAAKSKMHVHWHIQIRQGVIQLDQGLSLKGIHVIAPGCN
jgi:hypothetical protein